MKLTMTCKHCGKGLDADDEDELVAVVQAHARTHEGGPALSRDHILARLHRRQRQPQP
jgi:hypothetical protein